AASAAGSPPDRESTLAAVPHDRGPARIEFAVKRTESTDQTRNVKLSPLAFYRGELVPANPAIEVRLAPAEASVVVKIQQNKESLKPNRNHTGKTYDDQFKG